MKGSFTATTSMSFLFKAALRTRRPMRPKPLIPTLIFAPCSAAASPVGASGDSTAQVLDAFRAQRAGRHLFAEEACSTGLYPRTRFRAERDLACAIFFPAAFHAGSVLSVSEVLWVSSRSARPRGRAVLRAISWKEGPPGFLRRFPWIHGPWKRCMAIAFLV